MKAKYYILRLMDHDGKSYKIYTDNKILIESLKNSKIRDQLTEQIKNNPTETMDRNIKKSIGLEVTAECPETKEPILWQSQRLVCQASPNSLFYGSPVLY